MSGLSSIAQRTAGRLVLVAVVSGALALAGCAISKPLPPYQASLANQESLSRLPHGALYRLESVGDPAAVENQVRAYRFTAPNGGSWASYLGDGIRDELSTAGNYDAKAASTIRVTLLSVQIADGHAHVSARFVVERGKEVRYDKMLHADGRWRTSMLAAIAVPAASMGASAAFQDLLNQLFNDPDFIKAGT